MAVSNVSETGQLNRFVVFSWMVNFDTCERFLFLYKFLDLAKHVGYSVVICLGQNHPSERLDECRLASARFRSAVGHFLRKRFPKRARREPHGDRVHECQDSTGYILGLSGVSGHLAYENIKCSASVPLPNRQLPIEDSAQASDRLVLRGQHQKWSWAVEEPVDPTTLSRIEPIVAVAGTMIICTEHR